MLVFVGGRKDTRSLNIDHAQRVGHLLRLALYNLRNAPKKVTAAALDVGGLEFCGVTHGATICVIKSLHGFSTSYKSSSVKAIVLSYWINFGDYAIDLWCSHLSVIQISSVMIRFNSRGRLGEEDNVMV